MATKQRQRVDAVDNVDVIEEEEEEIVPAIQEVTAAISNSVITPADLKGGKIRLSSGDVYEIKRAKLMALAVAGKIPNSLIPAAVRAANKGLLLTDDETDGMTPEEAKEAEEQNSLDTEKVVAAVVCAVSVNPKIVMTLEEETEDNVWVGSLDFIDRWELYNWAMAGNARWAEFRIIG